MISINSKPHAVLNSYSSGPGQIPHTYDIVGGYVYEIAGIWKLQRPGQYPAIVMVQR